jgi:hypothetical protein
MLLRHWAMGTLFWLGALVHAPSRETMKETLDELILPTFGGFEVRNFDDAIDNRWGDTSRDPRTAL